MQIFKFLFLLLVFFVTVGAKGQAVVATKKLTIKITNIKENNKILYVGIYRAGDDFPAFNKYWKNIKVVTSGSSEIVEFEVPVGEYAVAISHDLNGNGKLDKNLFGYPKEPFGFSNNFKPKLSSPSFSDCKFTFNHANSTISIKLID